MISAGNNLTVILSLLFVITCFKCNPGVGLAVAAGPGDGVRNDPPFCRHLRNTRTKLVETIMPKDNNNQSKYPNISQFECSISDCSNFNCSMLYNREKIESGIRFSVCDLPPQIKIWAKSLELKEPRWQKIFKPNKEPERYELLKNDKNTDNSTKWFVVVNLHGEQSVTKASQGKFPVVEYLSINISFQVCDSLKPEECPIIVPLIDLSKFSLNSVCEGRADKVNSTTTNTNIVRNIQEDASSKSITGKSCDPQNIFSCGVFATCSELSPGHGLCYCMNGYIERTSGSCVKRETSDDNDVTTNTTVAPRIVPPAPTSSGSHSTVVGICITLLVLSVVISSTVYFGRKHGVFSRIRHRVPVNCFAVAPPNFWPFKRRQPSDLVHMVNPLYSVDDDDNMIL